MVVETAAAMVEATAVATGAETAVAVAEGAAVAVATAKKNHRNHHSSTKLFELSSPAPAVPMSKELPSKPNSPTTDKQVTRRDLLKSVSKYSTAAAGATIVAVSASEALAQATTSNGWNCRDYYPWWLCWWLGYQEAPDKNYGGWNGYEQSGGFPDAGDNSVDPW